MKTLSFQLTYYIDGKLDYKAQFFDLRHDQDESNYLLGRWL